MSNPGTDTITWKSKTPSDYVGSVTSFPISPFVVDGVNDDRLVAGGNLAIAAVTRSGPDLGGFERS